MAGAAAAKPLSLSLQVLLQRIADLRVDLGGEADPDDDDEPAPRLRTPARAPREAHDTPRAAGRGSAVGEGHGGRGGQGGGWAEGSPRAPVSRPAAAETCGGGAGGVGRRSRPWCKCRGDAGHHLGLTSPS
jgi:hypothetical protein